ncbi:MAG: tetratricopeptide repeat protein, partial [Runella slithyformis]
MFFEKIKNLLVENLLVGICNPDRNSFGFVIRLFDYLRCKRTTRGFALQTQTSKRFHLLPFTFHLSPYPFCFLPFTFYLLPFIFFSCYEQKESEAAQFFLKGNLQLQTRNYENAIRYYNEAIEKKPDFADAYCNRGIAYLKQEKIQTAFDDFNKAI